MVEDRWITVTKEYIERFIEDGLAGFKDSEDTGQLRGLARHGLRLKTLFDAVEEDVLKIKELFESDY